MSIKMYTWNVNGIRAISKKGFLEWFKETQPDILAVQEIKADAEKMTEWWESVIGQKLKENQSMDNLGFGVEIAQNPLKSESKLVSQNLFDKYSIVWHACSIKKGYSGTAIFYRKDKFPNAKTLTGLGVEKFDDEGRITILETEDFVLINGYYPQGGREGRIPFKIEFYGEILKTVQEYQKLEKSVILCGDLNTTVADIDLARPTQNRKTTGCLPIEREVLEDLKKSNLIDAFRHFYPEKADEYSYWDQITRARDRNVGWRIDYFLVDERLKANMVDCKILQQVFGSDHCPVVLELDT